MEITNEKNEVWGLRRQFNLKQIEIDVMRVIVAELPKLVEVIGDIRDSLKEINKEKEQYMNDKLFSQLVASGKEAIEIKNDKGYFSSKVSSGPANWCGEEPLGCPFDEDLEEE